MKRQYQFLIGGAIIAAILGGVVYQTFETTVFFYTPAEIIAQPDKFRGKTLRIGALVVKESTSFDAERVQLSFKITEDNQNIIPVVFSGVKPDLYREGQGVVVEGKLDSQGVFQASNLLVKHSEEYAVDETKHKDQKAAYRSLIKE
ncbi:MAG: cytochrome c maturation protein CcmE [Deltaproteobacteria bacterium]|nr:cytochrome c maturation protein CcmE [Deltaproteobacteria bacterium]